MSVELYVQYIYILSLSIYLYTCNSRPAVVMVKLIGSIVNSPSPTVLLLLMAEAPARPRDATE